MRLWFRHQLEGKISVHTINVHWKLHIILRSADLKFAQWGETNIIMLSSSHMYLFSKLYHTLFDIMQVFKAPKSLICFVFSFLPWKKHCDTGIVLVLFLLFAKRCPLQARTLQENTGSFQLCRVTFLASLQQCTTHNAKYADCNQKP